MKKEDTIRAVYVVKPAFLDELCEEIKEISNIYGDLVLSSQQKLDVCFAQDIWIDPQIVHFESISEAVKILRQANKFWYLHPVSHIRRSRLIEQQLRECPNLQRSFPVDIAIPKVGCFSLLDKNTLIFSVHRAKQWPLGQCNFIEDKINPPNRAYLKLWEALTLLQRYPGNGDTALDLGASPGGWTYVMQSLGAQVTAIDKADLAPHIAKLTGITYLKQSAFALDPAKLDQVYDWVLSDVACYPDRAYELIKQWIDSAKAKQMIFTIKLQGKTDLSVINQFKSIPNSKIMNLYYNKHEATFFYPAPSN